MKARAAFVLLLAALAVAAFLRFDHLGEPSYWLDEVLSDRLTTDALAQPWWKWVTGFDNEHGPLSFAVQLATRVAGRDELAGRLGAALLGLGSIALAWLATRSWPAAVLLAVSPLHVYYSREARPYALLLFLTAALIVTLLRESKWFYAVLLALLYSSAVAAPIVASAAVAALITRQRRFAIAAAAAVPLFLLLYRGGPSSRPDAPFPHLDFQFLLGLAKGFTVSAFGADILGRTAIVLLLLAVVGAIVMERRKAIVIVTMTLLPIVFAIASLKAFDHWFELRYVCAGVIGFALLAGEGMTRRMSVALVLAAPIVWQLWPVARYEPFQKLDWRRIAATIARYAKPGDLILAAEPSTGIVLPYYLAPHHRDRDVIQMSILPLAQRMIHEHPATWLVSAGTSSGAVRAWMCRYPVVLASGLDGFRMHYAGDFLGERGQAPEFRAATAAMSSAWFGEGWAAPESGFRWAIGARATIEWARWGQESRVIRLHVLPIPKQTMRVVVNGHVIGDVALPEGWSEQTFNAPADVWVNGVNTIAFEFGHFRAPASLDPANQDTRPLAASFDEIEVGGGEALLPVGGGQALLPVRTGTLTSPPLRIASAFIDERTVWRNTPVRLPGHNAALIGRLGFDPSAAQHIDLDDLATTLAAGSDCEDDRAWFARVYATLFQRAPTDPEIASLEAKRKHGDSRSTIIRHLAKSPELRAIAQGR